MNASELDQTPCATPGCNHDDCQLYLHSKCHPGQPVNVCYHKGTNQAEVNCALCGKHIVTLELYNPNGQKGMN